MPSVYIYDAVRIPRSRGKTGVGSLDSIKPINLLAGLLKALESRHQLDIRQADDVLMGCATGAGGQGSNIAKGAIIDASWYESVPDFQLDRFCTSDLKA
jgi:acetyl-CoA C-acetyltransferase